MNRRNFYDKVAPLKVSEAAILIYRSLLHVTFTKIAREYEKCIVELNAIIR
jgi:hypothetical protein